MMLNLARDNWDGDDPVLWFRKFGTKLYFDARFRGHSGAWKASPYRATKPIVSRAGVGITSAARPFMSQSPNIDMFLCKIFLLHTGPSIFGSVMFLCGKIP